MSTDGETRRLPGSMRIHVLGGPFVTDPDGARPWPGGHRGRILQALVVAGGEPVPAQQLAALAWPGTEFGAARTRLRVAISRLRSDLRDLPIVAEEGGYRIVAGLASLDAAEFLELARRAEHGDRKAGAAALALWRGEPYQGLTSDRRTLDARRQLVATRRQLIEIGGGPADGEIERQGLLARLPAPGATQVVALTAPAGFGKTTLIRQWLASRPDTLNLWLNVKDPLLPDALAPALEARRAAVVADDFQDASPAARRLITELIELAPASVTIVVSSRHSVRIPMVRFVEAGSATRLGASELRFSLAETERAVTAAGGDTSEAGPIVDATGGAPFAVGHLVSRLASGPADVESLPIGNLFDGIPPRGVALLERVAHLDLITPELAANLAGDTARALLDKLARRYLLLEPTDDGYMLLPIVANSLRARLRAAAPRQANRLQAQTARWYATRWDHPTALAHALSADDTSLIAELSEAAVKEAFQRGDAATLSHWQFHRHVRHFVPPARERLMIGAALLGTGTDNDRAAHQLRAAMDAARRGDPAACLEITSAYDWSSTPEPIEAIAGAVSSYARLLLDQLGPLQLLASERYGDYPWLYAWVAGQKALRAFAAEGPQGAASVLDQISTWVAGLAPTWGLLENGSFGLARALVDADGARLMSLADELADRGNLPLSVLARYGAFHAMTGDDRYTVRHTTAALDEADTMAQALGHVPFLSSFRRAVTAMSGDHALSPVLGDLSDSAQAVLGYLTTGMTFDQIADRLFVSRHTVRSHAQTIYRKLGVSRRSELSRVLAGN